jgi:hypothetical protein
MSTWDLSRYLLTACAGAALLTGCAGAGSQPAVGAPQMRTNPITKLGNSSGDLLYVANYTGAAFFTFPGGKQVGQISGIGHPLNACSDTSGNVWFTSYFHSHKNRLYEFAHGGTKPIATIDVPKSKNAVACAVNPTNGDLAVLNSYGETGDDSILVWPGGQQGTPKEYTVSFRPTACAYDKRGNLLATGWADSDGYFFAELKEGAAKVTSITVKPHTFLAGGLQWDGKYFAVSEEQRGGPVIYRLRVLGSTGKVVQTVDIKPVPLQTRFTIEDGTIVAPTRSHDLRLLGLWGYPLGGKPEKTFPGLTRPLGLAISVGT